MPAIFHPFHMPHIVAVRPVGWRFTYGNDLILLMEFRCEDFPQYGVALIPPTAPEYDELVADIRQRLEHPVPGSPPPLGNRTGGAQISPDDRWTSAVLMNRSEKAIAEIEQVWTFRATGGRTYTYSIGGPGSPSVLLPFGVRDDILKLYGYWHVILPGSKRYLTPSQNLGDNSDVRPPGPDEVWKGGRIQVTGKNVPPDSLEAVTLTLDGIFFADGGFIGPNRYGLWDQVTSRAEAQMQVARIARRGHDDGLAADQIFSEIQKVIGRAGDRPPAPPPPTPVSSEAYRRFQAASVAWNISINRNSFGDERTMYMLMDWADAPVPHFHKL